MPTPPAPSTAEQLPPRSAAVWAALDPVIGAGTPLRVLDVGGGSGMFAVPLARLGHEVTVVDPSADALATLSRRASTAGVGDRVEGVQGDGDLLGEVLSALTPDEGGYDLVLCHFVLEVVDDPAVTLREIAGALRPGGQVSVAATNRAGAVLARAVAGHPVEALALREDRDPATARTRPTARRRFTPAALLALVEGAGLQPGPWRGVSVVADLLDAASGADPDAVRTLELALAGVSPYREVATGLHVLAAHPEMDALPPDLHRPVYGTGNLADVLPGAAAALGVPVDRGDLPADPLGLTTALAGARRVAVLLVDGLGADLVRQHADLAPTLVALASPVGDLSAPCPSTTPVSLTTLGTGLPPGSHGVLGFVTDVPGEDRALNHTLWRDDPDPGTWAPQPTVFARAAAAGLPTTVVAPYLYQGSGLSVAAYRGATYSGTVGLGDLAALLLQALHATPRALVYGYFPDLDVTGHVRGVGSGSWRAQLQLVDRMVEQVLTGLPGDAALLVTADHGMLDVPADTKLDIDTVPELDEGVRLLVGEPRARYVHAVPGAAADVLDRWRSLLGERAWVVSRDEAVASGVFGAVDAGMAARIGDVVALARGTWAFTSPAREPGPSRLSAYHGSLTATELAIPLLVAHGPSLG